MTFHADAPAQAFVLDLAKPVPEALRGAVLALGNFDGVHRGHAELARTAVAMAGEHGTRAAALTFEPHPRSVFRPEQPVFRLTSPEIKMELLAEAGLGLTFVLPFDRDIAAIDANAFIDDLLLGRLGAVGLVCGYDFHFGKGRAGSPELLHDRAAANGIPVSVVPPYSWAGEPVSSTLIRTALEAGDITRAADFLGRPWFVRGVIAHGDKRGRELGYPTANMHLARDCRLRYGIYAVRMKIDGIWRDGVASFGSRPTFDDGAPRLETFVFDFSGDLYGKQVDVALVTWLRGEAKFGSLDALIVQMDSDSARARIILAQTPPFLP
ncbi:bifunctional riboflavin kinase/FAD synthetase [Bosea sp. PAMC 26642]|uniref:bifunctional riboflavin kinase/FAD synthetase n=1 Tax=Bosea sp. (strain PAMC 26642) TaxID=1792307 RepID=UPI0007701D18|nr:bifunctional riboflavin kinase/FAD synthetase [Bosea sp. PAMC 26642]AMJ58916.1 bifunctional riboflavin kinase/FMN adenylyltransferase [Bosea sp. PAMC 26642]